MTGTVYVKRYGSWQTGVPPYEGTVGSFITLLDALLKDGWNTKTITITRSGTTATASCTAHGFIAGDPVLVSGADQTDYNGDFTVVSATANTFTYTVANSPATPATGTISTKFSPVGWTKPYSGTNKAAYKMPTTANGYAATGFYLRVDDANAQYANVAGYEAMTDVDTGTGRFPTSGTANWIKSSTADGTDRPWIAFSDGPMFYFFGANYASNTDMHSMYWFGDFPSFKAADAYNCSLACNQGTTYNSGANYNNSALLAAGASQLQFLPRAYTQLGTAVGAFADFYVTRNQSVPGYQTATQRVYPNSPDNALHIRGQIDVCEYTTSPYYPIRGYLPGLYVPAQGMGAATDLDTYTSVTNLSGRTLQLIKFKMTTSNYEGSILVDITGPWR